MDERFKSRIFDIIKDKFFYSNISGGIADISVTLPEQIVDGEILFDGVILFEGVEGIKGDIKQITSYTKDRVKVNLEEYYRSNGAFDEDGMDRFIVALNNLMTLEEYRDWIFIDISFGDRLYTNDNDEIIFLAEKDGIYWCGIKGCCESIPYDQNGKCLKAEVMGVDVRDGRLDATYRVDFSTELVDTFTVEEMIEILTDKDHPIDPKSHIIVDKDYAPVTTAYNGDGYLHIATQRLSPNPSLKK